MRILMGIFLSLMYFATFLISYKKTKDIFNPLGFFSIMQFIGYIPGILFFEQHMNVKLTLYNVSFVFIYQIIVLITFWIGVEIYNDIKKENEYIGIIYEIPKNNKKAIYIFILGLISSIYFIYSVGGISFIMNNIQMDFAAGNSYLLSLQLLMPIGIASMFITKEKPKFTTVALMFLIYAANIFIFTRRAPILEALLLLIFIYNYRIKRISLKILINPKIIASFILLIFFILIMPTFRGSEGFSIFSNFSDIIKYIEKNILGIFGEFSNVSQDAFIYTNFNSKNFYLGKTFINIVPSFLPSTYFPWKPPVDDGLYLSNFILGNYISPPGNIFPYMSSYPFSNQGSMYANFGIIGVIIGSIIIGYIYSFFYNLIKKNNYNVFTIIIYQLIVYKFVLSTKNIVQTLLAIILTFIVFKLFYKIKIYNSRTVFFELETENRKELSEHLDVQ